MFLANFLQRLKNIAMLTVGIAVVYMTHHKRLSSPFYLCQLSDMFSYETPTKPVLLESGDGLAGSPNVPTRKAAAAVSQPVSPVVVYNFHSFLTQDRFFMFATTSLNVLKMSVSKFVSMIGSIAELFFSANWLEREISELFGMIFRGKKDIRNLMLQFGDLTAPLRKAYPSIGLRDIFYYPLSGTIIQARCCVQT